MRAAIQRAVPASVALPTQAKRAVSPVPAAHVAKAVQPKIATAAGTGPRPSTFARGVVQAYLSQTSKKSNKIYRFRDGLLKNGSTAIFGSSTDGAHTGYIRYSFHVPSKTCILEHIETDPENGTGLGPVLMNLLAKKAKDAGCTKLDVSMPRYPVYYTRWGFQMQGNAYGSTDPDTILGNTGRYILNDWSEWADERFAAIYIQDRIRAQANLAPVLTSFPRIE